MSVDCDAASSCIARRKASAAVLAGTKPVQAQHSKGYNNNFLFADF